MIKKTFCSTGKKKTFFFVLSKCLTKRRADFHFMGSTIITVLIIWLLMNYVLINAYVPTGSMKNTIMPGNRLIGIRLIHEYRRGDIVIFKQTGESGQFLIKRIIGIPGDNIQILKGVEGNAEIYVNGVLLSESYLPEPMLYEETLTVHIPENGYFMLGDNRNHSFDARYWENKIIDANDIVGIAKLRYWPFKEAKLF